MSTLHSYGDSWAVGWNALNSDPAWEGRSAVKSAYPYIVSSQLGLGFENYAVEGYSFAYCVHEYNRTCSQIQPGDTVMFTLPPDTRWISTSDGHAPDDPDMIISIMQPAHIDERDPTYDAFIHSVGARPVWFHYHNTLFVDYLIADTQQRGANLVIWHNYGTLNFMPWADLDKYRKYFVSLEESMWDMLGFEWPDEEFIRKNKEDNNWFESDSFDRDGPLSNVVSPYAALNDNHPNEVGHRMIAERIYDHICNK